MSIGKRVHLLTESSAVKKAVPLQVAFKPKLPIIILRSEGEEEELS